MSSTLRALPAYNTNYNPPRPWVCMTREAHGCDATVVGALGALPVCRAGAVAEQVAARADAARIAALMDTPAMRAEAARERRWEQQVS